MLRALVIIGLVVAAFLVGGLMLGFGPAAGDGPAEESSPTATPTATGGTASDGGTSTATRPTPVEQPFAVTIDDVADCGTTCRDVTVTLTNRQRVAADDVDVHTRVFAGNSTEAADEVWRGGETVGTLAAGDSYTTTKRVELSYQEALAVEDAGGWVTVQTTVQTADGTVTFTERRNVG